ncbi:MAG: metal ABC transporter substrate-binding protein [Dehalococcoidia bacterium]
MRRKILIVLVIAALVGVLVTLLVRAQHAQPSADIMAGSSLIANIIQDVAGDKMETRTLIPPGVCPGHYDVKPSDIEALANSKALFIHDYQEYFQNITGAIEAAENPDLIITVLNVTGNWMVPQVQAEAVDKIAQALGEIDPENAAYYQGRAAERVQAILAKGEEVRSELLGAGVVGVKVICADMQAGFVSWAGFNITATYGRPEDLTPAEMKDLIDTAKEAGVALVIDNLQSGTATLGAAMEQDVEAIPVTISNFPGGLENTETWEKAIDKNVDLLLEALNEWEEQYG